MPRPLILLPMQMFEEHVIWITISPILARLERLDDRVPERFEVLVSVLVGRLVTAADVSTDLAQTQVDPTPADLQTVFATVSARHDLSYFAKVFARFHTIKAAFTLISNNSTRLDYQTQTLLRMSHFYNTGEACFV